MPNSRNTALINESRLENWSLKTNLGADECRCCVLHLTASNKVYLFYCCYQYSFNLAVLSFFINGTRTIFITILDLLIMFSLPTYALILSNVWLFSVLSSTFTSLHRVWWLYVLLYTWSAMTDFIFPSLISAFFYFFQPYFFSKKVMMTAIMKIIKPFNQLNCWALNLVT